MIFQLMIPGTHNSGAIQTFRGYFAHNIVKRFSVNQEENIWTQLIMGIRFFDIRLKFKSCEAYVVHSFFVFAKFKAVLM